MVTGRRCDLGGWQRHGLILLRSPAWVRARHPHVWFLKPECLRPRAGGSLQRAAVLDRVASQDQEAVAILRCCGGGVYPTQALTRAIGGTLIGWSPVPRSRGVRGKAEVPVHGQGALHSWCYIPPSTCSGLAAHDTGCINALRSTKQGGFRRAPRSPHFGSAGHVWCPPESEGTRRNLKPSPCLLRFDRSSPNVCKCFNVILLALPV